MVAPEKLDSQEQHHKHGHLCSATTHCFANEFLGFHGLSLQAMKAYYAPLGSLRIDALLGSVARPNHPSIVG